MGGIFRSRMPSPRILFCHGNGGNIAGRLETIQLLHNLKVNMYLFSIIAGMGKARVVLRRLERIAMGWRHIIILNQEKMWI
jgi:hypothetical protein